MKFAYATVIVLCLLSSTSWSASNPLIRNCNLAEGEFTVVEIAKDFDKPYTVKYDQWALCKLGNSFVGALDVMFFNTKTADPVSFVQYKNNTVACTGEIIEARVLQTNNIIWLCQYDDQSLIDLDTLHAGPYDSKNEKLNNYLGLIFN